MLTAVKHAVTAVTASPFAAAEICALVGLPVLPGAHGSRFDDDVWDFTCVEGLPVEMQKATATWQFTKIKNLAWRQTAKEYLAALLAPGHEAVRLLPHAYRTPRALRTCHARLIEMTLLFWWLHARGLSGLADLTQDDCDAYIEHRSWRRDNTGQPIAPTALSSVACAYQVLIDLGLYRELFSADRYPAGLRPWKGRTAGAVSGRSVDRANKTAPVAPEIFGSLLAAALYVVDTLGPHIVALNAAATHARQQPLPNRTGPGAQALRAVIRSHLDEDEPFTALAPGFPTDRRNAIREAADPLSGISLRAIAREAGYSSFHRVWLDEIRDELEHALKHVGAQLSLGRDANLVTRAGSDGHVAWTLPMTARGLQDVTCYARNACMTVIGALTGMRASELMELRRGSSVRSEDIPGVTRYQLTSKLIKGQPLGGTAERWVVVDAVHRAVTLADQLQQDPTDDALLFGRFSYDISIATFRSWVNGPGGARLGLTPIPDGPVNLRMLRRRLAIELAYRPGGLLAAKVALKHIHIATTEGYSKARELHQMGDVSPGRLL